MSMKSKSIITCPGCGSEKEETMPLDSCQVLFKCPDCKTVFTPKPGDCCVYCSYGSVKCRPMQEREGAGEE